MGNLPLNPGEEVGNEKRNINLEGELILQPNRITEESATVQANGIRLHLRMAGAGYPLILLHGWPQTSYCWRKLVPLLAPHFRVIVPDLRGFGDSEKPEGPYDKRTVATDILEMARSLGYDNALVAGHATTLLK